MPILLIILAVVVVAVVILLVLALRQPTAFRITRSATINAPTGTLFALVNDFHRWNDWSPWAKLDPAMKTTYEGAATGTGAIQRWDGNKKVGSGSATIIESRAPKLVRIRLVFLRPFKATNIAEFAFAAEGSGTTLTWSMSGDRTLATKVFCLFMDMDKMVGGDFEKGLASLKVLAGDTTPTANAAAKA